MRFNLAAEATDRFHAAIQFLSSLQHNLKLSYQRPCLHVQKHDNRVSIHALWFQRPEESPLPKSKVNVIRDRR